MRKALIISSRENRLKVLAEKLAGRGYEVINIAREDVNSYELLEKKAEETGNVDVLVISSLCNANEKCRDLCELSTEEYQSWKYYSLIQFYDINRTIVKRMVESGKGGRVIGIISEAGVIPSQAEVLNGAAGAALYMGLQCMAEESHEDKLYTSAIALGVAEKNDDIYPMIDDAETILHVPAKKAMPLNAMMERAVEIIESTGAEMTGNVISIDAGFGCAYMREW